MAEKKDANKTKKTTRKVLVLSDYPMVSIAAVIAAKMLSDDENHCEVVPIGYKVDPIDFIKLRIEHGGEGIELYEYGDYRGHQINRDALQNSNTLLEEVLDQFSVNESIFDSLLDGIDVVYPRYTAKVMSFMYKKDKKPVDLAQQIATAQSLVDFAFDHDARMEKLSMRLRNEDQTEIVEIDDLDDQFLKATTLRFGVAQFSAEERSGLRIDDILNLVNNEERWELHILVAVSKEDKKIDIAFGDMAVTVRNSVEEMFRAKGYNVVPQNETSTGSHLVLTIENDQQIADIQALMKEAIVTSQTFVLADDVTVEQ